MASQEEISVWDVEAENYDLPADHGLRDETVRNAWKELLIGVLPTSPAKVADLGCGTGTLSLLLAQSGFFVDGLDFSQKMLDQARAKTKQMSEVELFHGDAFEPNLLKGSYDVVLSRHLLWAMPDPSLALERWIQLLKPSGLLVLVEGFWSNGVGLTGEQTMELIQNAGGEPSLTRLTQEKYWGAKIEDDRYLVTSHFND
jgi:ubiquinone/menaquinone biosynthesis C-methylase UbiE